MAMDALPECSTNQRCVRFDVRAHHEYVARLQCRVVLEQSEQAFAEHLDLPCRPVASVDLNCPIRFRCNAGSTICDDIGLDRRQEGFRAGWFGKMHRLELGGTEADLKFTNVASKTRQQRIGRYQR